MNYKIVSFLIGVASLFLLASCNKDLNRKPINGIYSDSVYSSIDGYKQSLAKVYGAFALTGTTGPGATDLAGIDAGLSDFVRMYWNVEELASDEAICAWTTDANGAIQELNTMNWSANDAILTGLYYRSFYQITVANSFLREATASAASSHGISSSDTATIRQFAAEARFIKSLSILGFNGFICQNK